MVGTRKILLYLTLFIFACLTAGFFAFNFAEAASLANRLRGRILLQVEQHGEAWYINPDNEKRYYLGRPDDAFQIMRELGLGISENDFNSFHGFAPARLGGKILLRVQSHGEAYYVNPIDRKMHYLGRPSDAFGIMRNFGLGIADSNLDQISIDNSLEIVNSEIAPEPISTTLNTAEDRKRLTDPGYDPDFKLTPSKREKTILCNYANGCEIYKGVEIWWKVNKETFPAEWVADVERINPQATSVSDDKAEYSLEVMKNGLDKYPQHILDDYLHEVHLVGSLNYFYRYVGGTVSPVHGVVYNAYSKYEDSYEQTLHHEFSSILRVYNSDDYFERDWTALNPEGFEYGEGYGGYYDEELAEQGFVSTYSTNSYDNDFNVMAEHVFKEETKFYGANFWEVVDAYSKIRAKLNFFVDFYHKIDPIFTEDYFRSVWED